MTGLSEMAFVSLGSNLGDSRMTVLRAFDRLSEFSRGPILRSSLWQSSPVDCPPGSPLFVNAVAALNPLAGETPESLLQKLQVMEREFGRAPKRVMNEPRSLDLDLITFGQVRRSDSYLVLPHPRAHLRRFVLEPLAEIAPDLILPGQTLTTRELLKTVQTGETVSRLEH